MHLRDVPQIDPRLVERLVALGYGDLWPSQVEAAPVAVAGENLVLAVPTASGKSLVAYLALVSRALKGRKGIYIVPLRALASEKFEDLKEIARPLGLRVALAMGDLDAADPQLGDFDLIVATSEKADALMRHRAHWLQHIGAIVADEVHLLDEPDRGPTLEVLLARFQQHNPGAQIVALSATIANSAELARWLQAKHVKTEWRPVTLREGIHYGRAIQFTDNAKHEVQSEEEDATLALTEDALKTGGQVLVFVNTRKSTETAADKLAGVAKRYLSKESEAALREAAKALKGGVDETAVERKLAKGLAAGAAFHHAGLTNTERALVERLFKEGHIKALAATPTLAAGINLPARRVIIRDLTRFEANEGNVPIPVLDYKQMAGRAGRPKYDKVGEAITIAKTYEARSEILLNYVLADPERVRSKLGTETALRTHLLSSIASGFVKDERTLKDFISHTFYAQQGDLWTIERHVNAVLDFLLENDLVKQHTDTFEATPFGKRVSELYIDPLSAVKLRGALARYPEVAKVTDVSFLHATCATPDMRALYARRTDAWLEGEAVERESELLIEPERGLDHEFFLGELKTAMLLHDWIEEATEDQIVQKYQVYPGDIHNKVETAEWLLYAMGEIARLYQKSAAREVQTLATRIHHGAKAELLPLLKFRGIGRYRARQLWTRGYKTAADLRGASAQDLAKVPGIGPALAESIRREAGAAPESEPAPTAKPDPPRVGQTSLGEFE